MDLRAPDFSSQPINNLTLQWQTIPAYAGGYLSARTNASWEQAVVVYFDGQRHPTLLGNYGHAGILWFGESAHQRQVLLAGWHKRSGPDGGQPWNASRGQSSGRLSRWNDSGGDLDFDDVIVEVVVFGGIKTHGGPGTIGSSLVSAGDIVQMSVQLAALDAAGRHLAAEARQTLHEYLERATCEVTKRYVHAHREIPTWPPPVTAAVVLAAEYERVAQTFAPGSIRSRLEDAGRRLLTGDSGDVEPEPKTRAAGA
jgi:hypothetical protein